MARTGFEGLAGPDGIVTISDGYAGFDWTNAGTLSRQFVTANHPISGYHNVLHKKGVAYPVWRRRQCRKLRVRVGVRNVHAQERRLCLGLGYRRPGDLHRFEQLGEHVTFQAFLNGAIVGSKVVVMDQTAHTIHFGKNFQHIDSVHILSDGGTDANRVDGVTGADIAMDNLKSRSTRFQPASTSIHRCRRTSSAWLTTRAGC